ncbi:unnamed protein product, partial [Thelazia callipaeda]|uniref:RING-CH-type domain-containing protein n=1 Tax=Thelazia callipaeda TaxID=103827 RepID=A0A0N5CRR3_THECL
MAIERSRNSSSPALIFDNINGAEVETDDTLPSRYTGSNSGNDSCRIVQESRKSEDISLIEPVVSQALIPVTVSEAQFQMSTENREGPMRVIHFQESVHVDISNSPKTISDSSHIEKRACRICQSETGEMVRPCACTGT